jgi:glycosyltransferase involved in cell wall biosynthesis
MKRLAQIVSYYNPPHVGGMEMRARERAERLAEKGWFVETLTSAERTYPHTVTDEHLIVRYLKSREIAHTPIMPTLPIAMMKIPKDSAVQVEMAIAYCPEITALICKLRRLPYIARVPGTPPGHSKLRDALLVFYQGTVLRWAYKNASLVIVLTEDDVALVTERYHVDARRIRVIANGTDFTALTSPRPGFQDPFRLLFTGRVAIQKNVPLLLESLRHFINAYSLPIHLNLVGDGEDMPRVKHMIAELSLQEYVDLKGYVTGKELESLYEQADAFVMTSTHESFPQVLLEAMAKGLPIVAGNIHGVRTVVEHGTTGLLVDLKKTAFAAAFHRVITENGLYQKLSHGSLEAAAKYDWDMTIEKYTGVYDELLEGTLSKR